MVGAGLDIAVQITTNIITGKRWNDIDGKSVLISAASGAIGAGAVNKVKQMMTLTSKSAVAAAEVLTDATVNGIESALDQAVSEKNVSLEKTVIDAGIGALSSTAGQGAKFLKQANGGNELKTLERQLDRAERLATDSSRASRQSNLNEARAKVENYGDKDKTIISSLTNYFSI